MQNRILSIKNLLALVVVVTSFLLITRLPVEWGFQFFLGEKVAVYARYVTLSIILIVCCSFTARRFNLLTYGGFIFPNKRNYWMLLLPLFFPGVLFFNNIRAGCLINGSEWLIMSFIVLIRAMMEEVLCRGLIQGYLLKNYSQAPRFQVVFASASVFAVFHFIGLMTMEIMSVLNQVLYALMVGLLFGSLVLRVRNVWLVGVVHGILNLIAKDCNGVEEVSQNVGISEYFIGLIVFIFILSPTILISWLLVKTDPSRKVNCKDLQVPNT